MSRAVNERIAEGMVAFWRDRVRHLDGHAIHEVDGLVVCLSNLPDDAQNVALIEREPVDARAALADAERVFDAHGRSLGLYVERGRHPSVESEFRAIGLEVATARPAMAVGVDYVEPPQVPGGVEVVRVTEPGLLAALVDVEVASFGTERPVAEGLFAPSQLGLPNVRICAAIADGRAVAQAWTNTWRGAVGIFGVGTVPELRHRGIGSAITAFAIDDVRDEADLAWLQSTEMGQPLYERMGFRPVSDWDVWVRR
jgi:GNAT superfamily N-acetyltransferase